MPPPHPPRDALTFALQLIGALLVLLIGLAAVGSLFWLAWTFVWAMAGVP